MDLPGVAAAQLCMSQARMGRPVPGPSRVAACSGFQCGHIMGGGSVAFDCMCWTFWSPVEDLLVSSRFEFTQGRVDVRSGSLTECGRTHELQP